jgi:hypothetical protein
MSANDPKRTFVAVGPQQVNHRIDRVGFGVLPCRAVVRSWQYIEMHVAWHSPRVQEIGIEANAPDVAARQRAAAVRDMSRRRQRPVLVSTHLPNYFDAAPSCICCMT